MKPTDRIGLPDLPICRNNPFAKGVSINQDMVMEEDPTENRELTDFWRNAIDKGRVQLVCHDPNNLDRYNADIYQNHPTLGEDLVAVFGRNSGRTHQFRELLALGREEE